MALIFISNSVGGFWCCGALIIIVGLFFFILDKTCPWTDEERKSVDKLNSLIFSCSGDERRTQRLISDPLAFLAAHGIDLPEGVQFTFTVRNKTLRAIKISHPDPKSAKTILLGTWDGT